MNNAKLIFGGILVSILLGIYAYLVMMALLVVLGSIPHESFTPQMASSLSLIAGLVSALVIAELAVTQPGEAPGTRILSPNVSGAGSRIFVIAVLSYLAVWTLAGLAAYIYGYLKYYGSLTALTDLGQSWIGVAIAAGYSYFGIKPSQSNAANNKAVGAAAGD